MCSQSPPTRMGLTRLKHRIKNQTQAKHKKKFFRRQNWLSLVIHEVNTLAPLWSLSLPSSTLSALPRWMRKPIARTCLIVKWTSIWASRLNVFLCSRGRSDENPICRVNSLNSDLSVDSMIRDSLIQLRQWDYVIDVIPFCSDSFLARYVSRTNWNMRAISGEC